MKALNIVTIAAIALTTTSTAFAGPGVPTQLPEPGTLVLLAGGVATALLIRRKKK